MSPVPRFPEDWFADALMEIDETTDARQLRANSSIGAGVNFKDPWGIRVDEQARIAYVVDPTVDTVAAIDLATAIDDCLPGPHTEQRNHR